MKKTLFIGSTVLDMVVRCDHLPATQESINTESIQMSLGGCAYNASNILELLKLPYLLCSGVGDGFFSKCVESLMLEANRTPYVRIKGIDNGCCICLVDKEGERSFLSQHGVEYRFNEEWLQDLDSNEIDSIYVCGLEIEDADGEKIIHYLEKNKDKQIYFAPASRILKIQPDRMDKMMKLHPILHMNQSEALTYTKCNQLIDAIIALYEQNKNTIIVTLGEKGAYVYENGQLIHVPGIKTEVKDTIGAGDSHIGSIIAFQKLGYTLVDAVKKANCISAKVVSVNGSSLTEEQFRQALDLLD